MIKNIILSLLPLFALLFIAGCGKKTEVENKNTIPGEFLWKDNLTVPDIPDFPVKDFLTGKLFR